MKSDERILGDGEFTQFVLDPVKRGGKIANAEQLELELVKEYKVSFLIKLAAFQASGNPSMKIHLFRQDYLLRFR